MSSMSSFFTQAGNFGGAVSGSVDPRTGLFNVRIGLGNLVGNRNLGPSLPLGLSYSPLNTTNSGLGQGVSLGLTTYDRDARLLALSSGEQYKVQETEANVTLIQKKLDTVHVTKDQDAFRIINKSGDTEILTGPRNAFALKVPTALLTPAGHSLSLSWDFSGGPHPRLKDVKDESDTLLTVDYVGDTKATLNVLPGRSEGFRVELWFQNGLPASVHHFGLGPDEPLVWNFSTSPIGDQGVWGSWITGVTMPGGMSETAYYPEDGSGHRFPESAGLPMLPYVTRYVQNPGGGQPQIEARYSYTDTNFLGGYSGAAWDADQDTLYGVLTGYSYGSTESRACAGKTTKTTRTYNNYHLQTDETTSQNGFSQHVRTAYYAEVGRPFDQQDNRFQLPKTRTVTWTDPNGGSRGETTETSFDDAGNPQSQTDPDGTRTDWSYYPVDGSGSDCPPDPNGFSRWLKDVTHTPPPTEFDAPVYSTSYSYTAYPTPDARVPTVVLKSEERRYADAGFIQREHIAYSTSADAEFGRVTGLDRVEFPNGDGGESYTASHTFGFRTEGEALVQTHALTTHDRLTTTRSQRRSRFTGRLWSATDTQGNVATTSYDGLGRVLTATANPGTEYEAEETYFYEVGTSAPFVLTSTDELGNQRRQSFDGAGRPILGERKDTDGDGAWYTMRKLGYDEQGRTAWTTATDYLPGGGKVVELTQTYTYDDWGQASGATGNDGSGTATRTDPVGQTSTIQQTGGGEPATGTRVTTYNSRGEAVKTERFDLRGASGGHRVLERDGWGRLRRETDEVGNTAHYDYDVRGRLTRSTLPDGTVSTREYAPFTSDGLATKVAVDGTPYGTRTFDGLGRTTSAGSGGRDWSYEYTHDSDPLPTRVTTPDRQNIAYAFVPQLDNVLSQVQVGPLTQTLGHDPVSGSLTSAREDDVTVTREYKPSGLPHIETTTRSGEFDTTAQWGFTLGGLEHVYTGVDGATRQTGRDTYGRVTGVTDPAMTVSLGYDPAGRLTTWTAEDPLTGYTLTTTLTLDDFGREVGRATGDSQGHEWSLVQEWQDNDLVSRRTLCAGSVVLRDETFAYNERNHLRAYTCEGSAPPTDDRGNQVVAQTFAYDAYGNVTTCESRFTDGDDTATYLFDNPSDPCQLTGINHTGGNYPPQVVLGYDAAGRLTTDDAGRTLDYDPLGRLWATGPSDQYGYDPLNRLLSRQTDGRTSVMSYRGESLATVTEDGEAARLLDLGDGAYVAQHRGGETRLLGTDGTQSAWVSATTEDQEHYAYTPYGRRPVQATSGIVGYTGQQSDPATGWYHLGNGTRAYNPATLRFNTPDSLSPFGAGGVNPYTYCQGDPINRTDPSGHFFIHVHLNWKAWLGIGMGVAGLALTAVTGGMAIAAAGGVMAALGAASTTTLVVGTLGVVSDVTSIASGALETASPKAASILGWVSLGTGVAGAGLGLAGAAAGRAPETAEEAGRGIGLQKQVSSAPGKSLKLAQTRPEMHAHPVVLPARNPKAFYPVFNREGARVWVSQDPVNARMVREVAEDALRRGKTVHILSGTHGGALGERPITYTEQRFYFQDLGKEVDMTRRTPNRPMRSTWSNRVYVFNTPDLTFDQIGRILRGDSSHEIIAAFCFSRNDDAVREFLGLEATYSYSSRVDEFHTAL